ncbi:MAG: hypothetical protein ACHQ50_05530 [Fimbriimonadales bacterium]
MREEITFRVAGGAASDAVSGLASRRITERLYEVILPLDHSETRRLFGAGARLEEHGWFISMDRIRRSYSEAEYAASPAINVNAIRHFPEPMREPDGVYEFDPECPCNVPVLQLRPLALAAELKCKDALVRLSDGALACKPELVDALVASDLQRLPVTPIFASEKKYRTWLEKGSVTPVGERVGPALPGPIERFRLGPSQIHEFAWLQIHPPVGPFSICPPTDGRHTPYREDHPSVVCACDAVYGPGLVSELYLRGSGDAVPDWSLTKEFIGSSKGVFLPWRPLLVSQRCFRLLRQFRTHNINFECVHIVP